MNDIIKIIKPIENSGVFDGITEAVKHEIKKTQNGEILIALLTLVATSLVKGIFRRGVKRAGRRYNKIDHMD